MRSMSRYSLAMVKVLFLFIAVSVVASGYAAASELLVLPTRVVLEGRGSEDFQVINPADETVDYRVTVQHYSQQPDGVLKLTDRISKRQLLAQKIVRYSPRKSTLKPKQKQIVRALARPVPNLPDGEYRLHLHFEPIATGPFKPEQSLQTDTPGMSIQIKLMVAVAVPVFYRHGETHLEMAIDQFAVVPPNKTRPNQAPAVQVRLLRKGNRSAFGDVAILHKAPEAAEWATIGKLGGVPIYLPNSTVTRIVPLELPPGVAAASLKGQVKVQFRDREKNGKQILAEKIFNL